MGHSNLHCVSVLSSTEIVLPSSKMGGLNAGGDIELSLEILIQSAGHTHLIFQTTCKYIHKVDNMYTAKLFSRYTY